MCVCSLHQEVLIASGHAGRGIFETEGQGEGQNMV